MILRFSSNEVQSTVSWDMEIFRHFIQGGEGDFYGERQKPQTGPENDKSVPETLNRPENTLFFKSRGIKYPLPPVDAFKLRLRECAHFETRELGD